MHGIYVSIHLTYECENRFREWLDSQDVPNQPFEPLHSTIVYCRKPIDWEPVSFTPPKIITPKTYEWQVFGDNSEILVLSYEDSWVTARHEWSKKYFGYEWDFDEYIPHVTVSYKAHGFPYEMLPLPDFNLEFDCEVIEELKLDDTDT